MKTSVLASILIVGLGAAGGAGYWAGQSGTKPASAPSGTPSKAPAGPPPTAVEAAKVASIQLPQSLTAVGSLRSDEAIILRPEVSGRILEIQFQEGQRVKAGQVLVRLDSSVQRAELEQAKANLSLSKSKYERAQDLQKKGFISSQARDEAENTFKVSKAAADLAEARLAKLDLKAPFSGIAGLRQVSVGDYVKDGQDLVNIEEVDPLKVDFRVPEIFLKQVAVNQQLQLSLDAFPNETFDGKVAAINPLIDANGRSIVIRAIVRNQAGKMRPGMFARVRLIVGGLADSLVVPEQSLVPIGDDLFTFKVVDGKAQRVKVELGQRRNGMAEILRGVAKDEVIITAGQQKVREGSPVKPQFAAVSGAGVTGADGKPATARQP